MLDGPDPRNKFSRKKLLYSRLKRSDRIFKYFLAYQRAPSKRIVFLGDKLSI